MATRPKQNGFHWTDLSSPEALERFRAAAKANTERLTRSKQTALQALVDDGICTKSGKLTKRYR